MLTTVIDYLVQNVRFNNPGEVVVENDPLVMLHHGFAGFVQQVLHRNTGGRQIVDHSIMKLDEGQVSLCDGHVFLVPRVDNHCHRWVRGIAASRQVIWEPVIDFGNNERIDHCLPERKVYTRRFVNVASYVRLDYLSQRRQAVQTVEV